MIWIPFFWLETSCKTSLNRIEIRQGEIYQAEVTRLNTDLQGGKILKVNLIKKLTILKKLIKIQGV